MFAAEIRFSKNYHQISSIGWVPNASLSKSQSFQDWQNRWIEIENFLDLHIVADGNNIHPWRTIQATLAVRNEVGYEVKGLFVSECPIIPLRQGTLFTFT